MTSLALATLPLGATIVIPGIVVIILIILLLVWIF